MIYKGIAINFTVINIGALLRVFDFYRKKDMLTSGHPYLQQENNKAVNQSNTQTRSKLYEHGRKLEQAMLKAEKSGSRDDIIASANQVIAYVNVRNLLAPDIGIDKLTNDINGRAKKILNDLR